jgi:hypothetical protein
LGPGYYYVLFEDPDGIRLEVNFVPGAGLLADGAQFNPATGYAANAFVGEVEATLGKQLLDIAIAQGEAKVQPLKQV